MRVDELNPWELLQKQMTWKQLGNIEGKTILDFGCGNGVMSAYYAAKNKVIAIEPDQQVLLENQYSNVIQICGDVQALRTFEDGYFDVILCHNVLEYAENRELIVAEFERLLKTNGFISIIKHNVAGRVMQMAVLLNNFEHAHELLDGKSGGAKKYGTIHYYQDEDLVKWTNHLKINKVLGMRTFWDLQQNQELQNDKDWQRQMLQLEQRVSDYAEFKNIAFFHHIFLVKDNFY